MLTKEGPVGPGRRSTERVRGRAMRGNYRFAAATAVLALTAGAGGEARAQVGVPGNVGQITRPPYSPYLNLLRRDQPTVLNYYGLVRPEVDLRNAAQSLQNQVSQNAQGIADLQNLPPGTLVTGHGTTFLN